MTGWRIEKRDYSRDPWRIVDPDGVEVCRVELFEHPSLGEMPVLCSGYPTKQAAIEGLGDIAAEMHRRLYGGVDR